MKISSCFMCVLMATAAGCGEKLDPRPAKDKDGVEVGDAGLDAGEETRPEVVYSSDVATVKPILDTYCVGCHSSTLSGADRAGAPAGINYDTYEGAVASAQAGNDEIQSGGMPPSGSGLSADEKALFQRWVDTGLNK